MIARLLFTLIILSPLTAHAKGLNKLLVRDLEVGGRVLDVQSIDMNGDGYKDIVAAHLDDKVKRDIKGRRRRLISIFFQSPKNPRTPWPRKASRLITVPTDASLFVAGEFFPNKGGEIAFLAYKGITLLTADDKGKLFGKSINIKTPDGGFFDFPADGGLFLWTLAPDLTGKGRHSLLFPTKNGYLVYFNDAARGLVPKGSISVPSVERFGPPLETKFLNRFLTYFSRLSRVVVVDMNNDGLKDLVAYRGKGLSSFLQAKDGSFPKDPNQVKALDIVEQAAKKSKKEGDKKDAFENVKLALQDLNGDGRIDLVATKTIGQIGVFESLRTQVLIFLANDKGIQDERPNRIINLKGLTLFPEFTDFNGDRDIDLVLSSLRMDLVTNVKRAILSSVSTTYTVYLFRGGKRVYSKDADFERSVDVDLDLVEKQGQVRLSFFRGDFNGDGLKDMLTVSAKDRLRIVPSSIKSSFFSGKYLVLDDGQAVELGVRTSPNLIIEDLDRDKKDEIVFLYKKVDDPERRVIRIVEESK